MLADLPAKEMYSRLACKESMRKLLGMKLSKYLVIALLFLPQMVVAQPVAHRLKLAWPLACKPNTDCFVSGYPDLQAGTNPTNPQDYRCGSRTQSGLQGVDIRFSDVQTALDNQKVLAMAPGRVVFAKNDMPDNADPRRANRAPCGNEVRILHASGYQTRYCHLREGSLLVFPGQAVDTGHVLGMVGYSGDTQMPKLTVYTEQDGHLLDPFTGRALNAPGDCYSSLDKSLWQPDVPYPDVLVMATGFANYLPTQEDVKNGVNPPKQAGKESHHLAAWVQVFGLRKNDHELLEIRDPSGEVWQKLDRYSQFNAPEWLTFVQGARGEKPLPKGVWKANYRLTRDGRVLVERELQLSVK